MFACGGLELYFHGQEGLAAIFSPFAAILEKFIFFCLGSTCWPTVHCTGDQYLTAEKILWFIIFQHLIFQYFGAIPSSGNCVEGEGCLDG